MGHKVLLGTVSGIAAALVVACGGQTTTSGHSPEGGTAPEGSGGVSSAGSGARTSSGARQSGGRASSGGPSASPILAACYDGTGDTDCCAPGVAEGVTCDGSVARCSTGCYAGLAGHLDCTAGAWKPGNGTDPCSLEAGVRPQPWTVDAAALPACTWPAHLDPGDAAPRGACRAARLFLSCERTGSTQLCLSNDPTKCPPPELASGPAVCRDQCRANEYGAVCGAIGPAPSAATDLPARCRLVAPTPGGIAFYCCTCE